MVMTTAGFAPNSSERSPESEPRNSTTSRRNKVLVLESDDALREAVIGALGVAISAVGARTGIEALRLMDEISPTIVLANVQISDMDGIELLEQIRERLPGSKVIVTSDSGDYGLVNRVMKLGVGDFLEKPYGMDDLYHSLDNSVRGISVHLDDRVLAARYHEKCRFRRRVLLATA